MEPSWADLPHALQALIASHLSPRTLAVAACSCRLWRQLAAERDWQAAFSQLWPLPGSSGDALAAPLPGSSWQQRYAARHAGSHAWQGRPASDQLAGHSAVAKCLAVLPERGLLFSGARERCCRGACAFTQWSGGTSFSAWSACTRLRRLASNVPALLPPSPLLSQLPCPVQAAWTARCAAGTCGQGCSWAPGKLG